MKDYDQIPQSNQHLNSLFGKFGFSKLTEIQKKASPIILQKKDCLVIAPTGSGKTTITVIFVYGVGADTAARILRNMVDEEHLFKQTYEAERQYVVTRGFWDS